MLRSFARLLAALLLATPAAFAATPTSIVVSPSGVGLKVNSTWQFNPVCTYSDHATDDCTAAGGVTWSVGTQAITVSNAGLVTTVADPGYNGLYESWVVARLGACLSNSVTCSTKVGVFTQGTGDTWYQLPTPDYQSYKLLITNAALPLNVVVGAQVQVGSGIMVDTDGSGGGNASSLMPICDWTSSDTSKATIENGYGHGGRVTALAPGAVTMTCNVRGNATFGAAASKGWVSPGNFVNLTIVAGGTSNHTWYIRPDGGTPYTSTSTQGQCDGLHDAAYPGSGVNQACAFKNFYDLYADENTYQQLKWVISGGDTVNVRQNPNGYLIGQPDPTKDFVNCHGDGGDCYMPTIPSGTAARHTRILGENYANCQSDSAKTKLVATSYDTAMFSVRDSQFVDVACFEMTDHAQGAVSTFNNNCQSGLCGQSGIFISALTNFVNFTDLFIHGLGKEGVTGSSGGSDLILNRIHFRGMPYTGINMDDIPYGINNLSVAGGFQLLNSLTEGTGCVEEYPIVHNYPYVECRDQGIGNGGSPDGIGTASAAGDWTFDNDVWRYNWQDGLDLLHSGLNSLTVTNSQSYTNNGQTYKIGSGRTIIFRNNIGFDNCYRLLQPLGDAPYTAASVAGQTACRASDGFKLELDGLADDYFQNNTLITEHSVAYDMTVGEGWYKVPNANAVFQNNVLLGYGSFNYPNSDGRVPGGDGGFYNSDKLSNGEPDPHGYEDPTSFPAGGTLHGWSVRDHNLVYNIKNACATMTQAGELCTNPLFTGQFDTANPIATPSTNEIALDVTNLTLTAGSPLRGAGTPIAGITTDLIGNPRPATPSIGALEYGSPSPLQHMSAATSAATASSVAAVLAPASIAPNGTSALSCVVTYTDGSTQTPACTYTSATTSVATISGTTATGLAAGTTAITAFGGGLKSPTQTLTVSTATPAPVPANPNTYRFLGNLRRSGNLRRQ